MIELLNPDEIVVPPQVAEFYGVELSDDDVLEAAEILEDACPGLGEWYLSVDPDYEIQRDLLALTLLFWERRKAPCKCGCAGKVKVERAKPRRPRPSPPPNGKRPTLLQSLREDRGLSQGKLAKLVGVTQPTIHRWETGRLSLKARVSPYVQANIVALLGKPFAELLIPIEQPNGEATITQAEGI